MNLMKKHDLLTKHNKFTDLFPHVAYGKSGPDTFFLLEDGNIGMTWISNPISGANDKVINSLAQSLQLDSWKEGGSVQFTLVASSNISPILKHHESINGSDTDVFKNMRDERIKFWHEGSKSFLESYQNTNARDFYVVISAKQPIAGDHPSEKELEKAEVHFGKFKSLLSSAGFSMTCLSEKGLSFIFNSILDDSEDASWNNNFEYDENETVRSHFLDKRSQVNVHEDCLEINDNFASVMTVKGLPEVHSIVNMASIGGDLVGGETILEGRFMCTLNIEIQDYNKIYEKTKQKHKSNTWQANGKAIKWFPQIGKKQNEFQSIFESTEDGYKIVRGYLTFVFFEKSKTKLYEKTQKASIYIKDSLKIEILQDKYFTLPLFLNAFPLSCDVKIATELQRYKTMTTFQIVQFAPIIGAWKGTGTYSNVLFSRNGQMMSFDPFDSKKSLNGAILAESGSGKSFLANSMISSEMTKKNSKVFIIDVGGSYKKLCHVLGGTFIDFDPKEAFILNPFEAVGSEDKDDESIVVTMLTSLIEMMSAKVSSTGDVLDTLDALQSASLSKIVANVYREHGTNGSIDLVVEEASKHENPKVQDIAPRLYKFTSESSTGKFFNGKSTINFDSEKMTVLELKHVEAMGPQVMSVTLFLMMSMIANVSFRSDQSVRKTIIIDEAWGILQKAPQEVVAFLETFYRRIRKSNGSAWIITQSIEDLFKSEAGFAIANNSPFKLYLGQTEASIKRAVEGNLITASPYQQSLMASTVNQKPHYSEIYVDADDLGWGVGRLIVDRYHSLLYSTEGVEVQIIDDLVESGMTYHEAILQYMADEKNNS